MQFLRKAAVAAASSALFLFLISTAFVFSLNSVVTRPASLKSWLKESNIYSTVVPAVLEKTDNNDKQDQSNDTSTVPLTNAAVKAAAGQAFTPDFLQHSAESIIDGTYSWLSGKSTTPNFKIDLTGAKATFATKVGDYLKQRLAALPACTVAQTSVTFEPFSATCIPKGVNITSESNRIANQIGTSKDFLGDTQLTDSSIKIDKNGTKQSVSEAYKNVPPTYQKLKQSPLITGVLAILAAAAIFFASATKRRGIRRIAVIMTVAAVIMLMSALTISRGVDVLKHSVASKTGSVAAFQQTGAFLVGKAGAAFGHSALMIAVLYAMVSVGAFVYLERFMPKDDSLKHDPDKPDKPAKAEPPKPKTPASTPGIVQ